MPDVKINCSEIPELQMRLLSQAIIAAVEAYFADPINAARFEAWQKEHKEAHA